MSYRLMLAPMEGVTDHTMRALLTSLGGLDRCVTEFVRVSDLLLPRRVFYRYCPELKTGGQTAAGTPVYLQLLGSEPQAMAENAARAAELGAPGIDINFGCPAKTVNRSRGGAVLLREPALVHRIVGAVRGAVPADIPVTVKIRLGFEDRSRLQENVLAIDEAAASELVVHARTKVDGYRPPAYWDEVARVRQWVSMPVIANGEIWSLDDARRCRAESGSKDLMLGRGILCRPDLALMIRAMDSGQSPQPLGWPDLQALVSAHLEQLLEHYDAAYACSPIKQWLVYMKQYYLEAALLFERVKRIREADEMRTALRDIESVGRSTQVAA